MKGDNVSVFSSVFMGVLFFFIGFFFEPLLMVLGGLIVVSGGIAKLVESRQLKYQAMEAERQVTLLAEKIA